MDLYLGIGALALFIVVWHWLDKFRDVARTRNHRLDRIAALLARVADVADEMNVRQRRADHHVISAKAARPELFPSHSPLVDKVAR